MHRLCRLFEQDWARRLGLASTGAGGGVKWGWERVRRRRCPRPTACASRRRTSMPVSRRRLNISSQKSRMMAALLRCFLRLWLLVHVTMLKQALSGPAVCERPHKGASRNDAGQRAPVLEDHVAVVQGGFEKPGRRLQQKHALCGSQAFFRVLVRERKKTRCKREKKEKSRRTQPRGTPLSSPRGQAQRKVQVVPQSGWKSQRRLQRPSSPLASPRRPGRKEKGKLDASAQRAAGTRDQGASPTFVPSSSRMKMAMWPSSWFSKFLPDMTSKVARLMAG